MENQYLISTKLSNYTRWLGYMGLKETKDIIINPLIWNKNPILIPIGDFLNTGKELIKW